MFDKIIENFNPMNFVNNLKYLGQGMLGILIVMVIIIVVTSLLNKFASKKNED